MQALKIREEESCIISSIISTIFQSLYFSYENLILSLKYKAELYKYNLGQNNVETNS